MVVHKTKTSAIIAFILAAIFLFQAFTNINIIPTWAISLITGISPNYGGVIFAVFGGVMIVLALFVIKVILYFLKDFNSQKGAMRTLTIVAIVLCAGFIIYCVSLYAQMYLVTTCMGTTPNEINDSFCSIDEDCILAPKLEQNPCCNYGYTSATNKVSYEKRLEWQKENCVGRCADICHNRAFDPSERANAKCIDNKCVVKYVRLN